MTAHPSKAYTYLIKIISMRDYSEHRLREKLREKKYSQNEIDSAIDEIKTRGYLREKAYTQSRIRSLMEKGYSSNFIGQKLAEEQLSATSDEIDAVFLEYRLTSEDQITRLLQKKMQGKTEIDFEGESRLLRYLISKGHEYSNSKKILKSLISQHD